MELEDTSDRDARAGLDDPVPEHEGQMRPEGDAIERFEEDERLLGGGKVKSLSTSREGWVSILGFSVSPLTDDLK